MRKNDEQLRELISKIANLLEKLSENGAAVAGRDETSSRGVCIPKELPKGILVAAARTAVEQNPLNAPPMELVRSLDPNGPVDLQRAALATKYYWGPQTRRLTVSFMEPTSVALREKIISHMNAWNKTAGISFVFTQSTGQVRISRGRGGYWSWLGTQIRHIAANRQTMNLDGFHERTSDAEFRRVVRHETGHTLGFPHEHMRRELLALIDRQKCYRYFQTETGWPPSKVDEQVLTPLEDASIFATTSADQTSIMCYQLPAWVTTNGKAIGGKDISKTDYWFAGKVYPKAGGQRALDDSERDAEPEQTDEEDESGFLREPLEL